MTIYMNGRKKIKFKFEFVPFTAITGFKVRRRVPMMYVFSMLLGRGHYLQRGCSGYCLSLFVNNLNTSICMALISDTNFGAI